MTSANKPTRLARMGALAAVLFLVVFVTLTVMGWLSASEPPRVRFLRLPHKHSVTYPEGQPVLPMPRVDMDRG